MEIYGGNYDLGHVLQDICSKYPHNGAVTDNYTTSVPVAQWIVLAAQKVKGSILREHMY